MAKKPQGVPWAHSWGGKPNYLEPVHTSYEEARAKRKAYDAARYAKRVANHQCAKCATDLEPGYTERTCPACTKPAKTTTATPNTHCLSCTIPLPPKCRYKRCLSCRSMYGRRGKYA